MDNSIESKPTGSGEATQTNQRPAGLSRKEFKTKHVPLDPSAQRRIRVLLTRQELASRWQCCPHTIQRMKNLRPVRFNRRRLSTESRTSRPSKPLPLLKTGRRMNPPNEPVRLTTKQGAPKERMGPAKCCARISTCGAWGAKPHGSNHPKTVTRPRRLQLKFDRWP